MQEELVDCVQAMVGYQAAPPYGALTIVGTGGVLVELEADKALSLSPVTPTEAGAMLATTRLGKTLDGYRNLIPHTDTAPLADLVANLSALAADFCDLVPECDLNPVLIQKGRATFVSSMPCSWAVSETTRKRPAARKRPCRGDRSVP
jgi:acetyltransferase